MGDNNKRTIHYDKTLKNLFISDRLTIYAINAFSKKTLRRYKNTTTKQRIHKTDKTTAIRYRAKHRNKRTKYKYHRISNTKRQDNNRMIDYGFESPNNLDYNNIKKMKNYGNHHRS